MQRIFISLIAVSTALLCACAESSDKIAARDYVKAAQKVSAAKKAFEDTDYTTALTLCQQARNGVEDIVSKRPDTPVALKVVTDASTLIGACSYAELNETVIPNLKTITNADMFFAELPWAIALSFDASARDAAMQRLARKLLNAKNFDSKNRTAVVRCLEHIGDNYIKNQIMNSMGERKSAEVVQKTVSAAAPQPAAAKKTVAINEPIFIKQAESEASLANYDVRAVDNLREKAKDAKYLSAKSQAEFLTILKTARKNVLKVSVEDMREKALATLAFAFSDAGDVESAIAIAQSLANPKLFADVFNAIAKKASSGKNYTLAIALAARLPDSRERDQFAAELAAGVAAQGLLTEAEEIVMMAKSPRERNMGLAKIAKCALAKSDSANFAKTAAKIDLANADLSWLDAFDFAESATELKLAEFAKILVPVSKANAKAANDKALAIALDASKKTDTKTLAQTVKLAGINSATFGEGFDAAKKIAMLVSQLGSDNAISALCSIAEIVALKDAGQAATIYRIAANLCGNNSPQTVIDLAWSMQQSGIERGECAKILKPFLPKFK